jgi:Tfp pilus assembly protein PilN
LPKELQPSLVNFRNFSMAIVISFLVLPGIGLGIRLIEIQTNKALLEIEKERNELNLQVSNQVRLREENVDVRAVQAVKKAMAEKLMWSSILKELSGLSPKGIWLTDLETKVDGEARTILITGEAKSQEEVAKFLENLEKSFFFREIKMNYSELVGTKSVDIIRFQFQGNIFEEKGVSTNAQN